jgi:hypothetical protein
MSKLVLTFLMSVLFCAISFAETVPLKLSLWECLEIPSADRVHGLELGIGNYTSEVSGVALNLLYSRVDNITGVQNGVFAKNNRMVGAQIGFVNFSDEEVTGVQFGFFNKAKFVSGIQLGFVNMTENMNGVQIGLVNFIEKGSLPVMVILNCKFD